MKRILIILLGTCIASYLTVIAFDNPTGFNVFTLGAAFSFSLTYMLTDMFCG